MQVVKKGTKLATHIVLILGSLIMIYPFVFSFLGMFLDVEEFYGTGFLPVPSSLKYVWGNLVVFFRRPEFYGAILITFGRMVWYGAVIGFTSVLGGYVFAKINFAGKKFAWIFLMSSMMVPGVALLIPQYLMFSKMGLNGNIIILFITGCFSAYNIFLLQQSFTSLGEEYREAAEIDGANFFYIVFGVYMPMVKPVLAVIMIQLFIGQWNDYLFPSIFLNSRPEYWPIGVVSVKIQSDYLLGSLGGGLYNYPIVLATAIIMMIPPVAVYVVFQKYFVSGLTMGGVKD